METKSLLCLDLQSIQKSSPGSHCASVSHDIWTTWALAFHSSPSLGATYKKWVYCAGLRNPRADGARKCMCFWFSIDFSAYRMNTYRMICLNTINVKQLWRHSTNLGYLARWKSSQAIASSCFYIVEIGVVMHIFLIQYTIEMSLPLLELNLYVGQLTPRQKADLAVKHAFDVQRSLSMGNYHALFLLYTNAPNMGAYIMDHFIPRERVKALMVIVKA